MRAKYIHPYVTFGFKRIFGEETSKPLVMDFLNTLLPPEDQIVDLTFSNAEQSGKVRYYYSGLDDIYCENEKGERFIVQMLKENWDYYKERTKFYSEFPISEEVEKRGWNPDLKAAYCIGILDFTFQDYPTLADKGVVVHTGKLKNQNGKDFHDKITYIYLEMPNFKKGEDELETRLDKWLYFIQNLEDIETIPAALKDEVFTLAFKKADLSKITMGEWGRYEQSLKIFRDNNAVMTYAFNQGKLKGKEEARLAAAIETATNMIREGESDEKIIEYTEMTEKEIEKLRKEL